MSDTGSTATKSGGDALDPSRIASYRQRRPGFLERLVTVYLDEAPIYFAKLKASTEKLETGATKEDLDIIRMAAHTLKSSSANLGAVRLPEICQKIETAALNEDIALVTALAATVGAEMFAVEQALKAVLFEQRKAVG